jgi:hypothetical protein
MVDGILMPQPPNLSSGGGGALLVRRQMRMLLLGCPHGVVLEVEQVLCILGQRSHPGVEMRALEVGHSLTTLLPYGVLLIPNQEKRDRQCCCSSEAVLTQGGEGDVHHRLNSGVGIIADDRPQPWLRVVEGYHHANLTPVRVVNPEQSAIVDQSILIVPKTNECIV